MDKYLSFTLLNIIFLSLNVKYCMYNILLWFNIPSSIYPKMTIQNFATLQTFPQGRSAMGGEGLQCCRSSGGEGLQGGRSAIQHRYVNRVELYWLYYWLKLRHKWVAIVETNLLLSQKTKDICRSSWLLVLILSLDRSLYPKKKDWFYVFDQHVYQLRW